MKIWETRGLGLSITKRLLNLMDSDIEVQSSPGFGSTFSFVLTVEEGKLVPEEDTQADHTADFKNKSIKILLVEDNRVNQIVATNFLKKWGLLVDIANHGKEAVEMVQNKSYQLILMDLQMPEMDGYEAAKLIRTMVHDSYFQRIPIIALTASAMLEIKEKVLLYGMNDFVSKPFQPEELQAKIAKYTLHQISESVVFRNQSGLDLYTEGDPEFKRALASVLVKNLEELQSTLQESLDNGSDNYHKTYDRIKGTIGMLGDHELVTVIDQMKLMIAKNDLPAQTVHAKVKRFHELCDSVRQGLSEEMNNV